MATDRSATPLSGQIALVTGASRGIGAAIAGEIAALGATVIICGRSRAPLEHTAAKITQCGGGRCEAFAADVGNLDSVKTLATYIKKQHQQLDILVNNAGIGDFSSPLHELEPAKWDAIINTNLRGVYYCIRAFAQMMIARKRGEIINISSLAGKNPVPNAAAYAASKWGLNGLSYSVAEELRVHNIRVSVVCPGSVHTDLSPHAGKTTSKMLRPDDVAHVVAMLVTQAPQSFASEVLLRPTQKP
jgi:NAD(P)-dependent dehydrogenase (short-subunit alcohol dehydrogenase family)